MTNDDDERKQIEAGFRTLLGRSATTAEMLDLVHIRDSLGLRTDDPLWMILYALQYYKVMYQQVPGEINASLDRVERIMAKYDASQLPQGWFLRTMGRIGWLRCLLGLAGALVVACAVGYALGSGAANAPGNRLLTLNGGGQALLTCFNGGGRIEQMADGHAYCFPVSADGKAFGYILK